MCSSDLLDEASRLADVVITSGGVSVGDYDYMREAVDRLGAIHHYKVAIKPGKPFVFGQMLKTWYFGLPGNPVSGYVGFDLFFESRALAIMWGTRHSPTFPFAGRIISASKKISWSYGHPACRIDTNCRRHMGSCSCR